MATTRRKVIGTATFSFGGSLVSLGVTSIPTGVSPEAEVDTVAAFGDEVATHAVRNLATLGELSVECIDEGAGVPAALAVGKVGLVTIALTFRNGVDTDVNETISEQCAVTHIERGAVEMQGERVATVTITLQPVGGADRTDVDFSAASGS